MKVVAMGDISSAYSNGNLPRCGMIVSADRDELLKIGGNLLYQDIVVANAKDWGAEAAKSSAGILERFREQICRCGEICVRLEAEKPSRRYTRQEVFAIIDELLDGIKPDGEESEAEK